MHATEVPAGDVLRMWRGRRHSLNRAETDSWTELCNVKEQKFEAVRELLLAIPDTAPSDKAEQSATF